MSPYTIIELNAPGGFGSGAAAINAVGDVAGSFSTLADLAEPRPFIYSKGNVTILPYLSFAITLPNAINDSGQIVGLGYLNDTQFHAFLYSNGKMTDLGTLGGANSQANDINNAGQIVGISDTGDGQSHGFLYVNGKISDLGTLGGSTSEANAINDFGQITGSASVTGDSDTHAFRSAPNAASIGPQDDLGTLGFIYSSGFDINLFGQVAGESRILPSAIVHGFLTDANSVIEPQDDLGALGGPGDSSTAAAVNSYGAVVGNSGAGPFLYTSGKMVDLNTLLPPNSGWVLQVGVDINDAGWIVGNGTLNGQQRGFLMIPPPRMMPPWVTQIEAEVQILFGVTNDGGGVVILPNGVIVHIPPEGPGDPVFASVARYLPEVLEAIAVRRAAQLSTNAAARGRIALGSLEMARSAIEKLLRSLPREEK
jgi:probable HAF family extracellular repeat protein